MCERHPHLAGRAQQGTTGMDRSHPPARHSNIHQGRALSSEIAHAPRANRQSGFVLFGL